MTTTATKTKQSPSTELAKLEQRRDELHRKAREARAELDAYDRETGALAATFTGHRHDHPDQYVGGDFRPRPGSEAAKMSAEIRQRRESPNPHRPAYDAAVAKFHRADEAVTGFRHRRLEALIAELDPLADEAIEQIRAGLEQVVAGAEQYAAAVAGVRELIIATEGIDGTALAHDPRPENLARIARVDLDSEFTRPRLTEAAVWKLGQFND